MGFFDNLEAKAGEIADKTGLAVTDVHAIANTFQANLTSSDGNPEEAIEAAAASRRRHCDGAGNHCAGWRPRRARSAILKSMLSSPAVFRNKQSLRSGYCSGQGQYW